MLTKKVTRLSADPTIGVADLMGPLDQFMKDRGSRHLMEMLKPPEGVARKSAPDCNWIAKNASLWICYLKMAPNTMLPGKKHRIAIEKLDQQMKTNFTKMTAEDFSDKIDFYVRMALKFIRELKQSAMTKERAYRKIDMEVQHTMTKILAFCTKVDKDSVVDDDDSQAPGEPQQLALCDGDPAEEEEPKPAFFERHPKSKAKAKVSPSKLFTKILTKKDSESSEIDITYKKKPLESASSTTPHLEDQKAPPKRKVSFLAPTMDLSEGEEAEIEKALNSGPIEDIRRRKMKPQKKKKAKKKEDGGKTTEVKKGKGKGKGKDKNKKTAEKKTNQKEKREETVKKEKAVKEEPKSKKQKVEVKEELAEEEEVKEEVEQVLQKTGKKKKKDETKGEVMKKPSSRLVPPDGDIELPDKVWDGMEEMKDGRAKVRHRLESRAHCWAMNQFKKLPGFDLERDKDDMLKYMKKARDQFKKEFDKMWPKDEEDGDTTKPEDEAPHEPKDEEERKKPLMWIDLL